MNSRGGVIRVALTVVISCVMSFGLLLGLGQSVTMTAVAHAAQLSQQQCAQLAAELQAERSRLEALKATTDRTNPAAVAAVNSQIDAYNTRLGYAKQSCVGFTELPPTSPTPPKTRTPQTDFTPPTSTTPAGKYWMPPSFRQTFQSSGSKWTTGKTPYNNTPAQNAFTHWRDHQSEFPGWSSSRYATTANSVAARPPSNWWTFRGPNGTTYSYDPASGILVAARGGVPATMFKPIDGAAYVLRLNGTSIQKALDDIAALTGLPVN